MGRRLLILLSLAAVAVLAAAASASARTSTVSLVPAAGPVGSTFQVAGAGFPKHRRATLKLRGARSVKVRVGSSGRFTTRLTVPTSSRGVLTLSTRSRGRSVTNRFEVTGSSTKISELATSRGQRLRWTVGAEGVALQGRGFAKRHRLRLRWLGRTITLRTNARGRFLTTLALPTSGASHPASLRIGSLRLKFAVLGPFGSGSTPIGPSGIPTPPPIRPGTVISPATPQAPQNNQAPTIAGAALVGATMAVDPGTWTATPPVNFGYQWRRCNSSGAVCSDIGGATGQTYVPSSADSGKTLRAVVTATNSLGSASATSASSSVVIAPPANTALPKITGTPQQGSTLTASKGTWSGTTPITYAYQWQRCNSGGAACAGVFGATGTTYSVTSGDIGFTLRVVVTATNSGGSSSATSAATKVVVAATTGTSTWHMNDSGSTMADSGGLGNNGQLHGVTPGQPGFSGSAFLFSGSSYVSVPSGTLNPGGSNLTITIYMKTTAHPPPEDWDLIRKGVYDTVGGEYKLEYYPDGQALCGMKGSGGYAEAKGGPDLGDGAWHKIECRKTGSGLTLLVDGSQVAAASKALGEIDNSEPVIVGSHAGASEFYQGLLDEASIKIG